MLKILTDFGKNGKKEWVILEVDGFRFRVRAQRDRHQASLVIDAPKDRVRVIRESILNEVDNGKKQ